MRKYIVIPYERYKCEQAGTACSVNSDKRCKTNTAPGRPMHTDQPAEMTNPTSVPAYTRALNKVTDDRPVMVKQRGGSSIARLPPKPPSRKLLTETLARNSSQPKIPEASSGTAKRRKKPKRLVKSVKKEGWMTF